VEGFFTFSVLFFRPGSFLAPLFSMNAYMMNVQLHLFKDKFIFCIDLTVIKVVYVDFDEGKTTC
jgi:hypothetical protein